MFAEIVVNIEAPLTGSFHYEVPRDMSGYLQIGHLVEVEFGRRLAQGIIIDFSQTPEVADTKPILSLIEQKPLVEEWQIKLARWLSAQYITPLNACLRLFLPPGMSRWADVTVEINRYWDGEGRLTPIQSMIIDGLREKGDMRGRHIRKLLPKADRKKWQAAVNQLAKRGIVNKATVLDPPRMKPKKIRTAELIAGPKQIRAALPTLGRASKTADILYHLLTTDDPLPSVAAVLAETGASPKHLQSLIDQDLITIIDEQHIEIEIETEKREERKEKNTPLQNHPVGAERRGKTPTHLPDSPHTPPISPSPPATPDPRNPFNAQSPDFPKNIIIQPQTILLKVLPKQLSPYILQQRKAEAYGRILNVLAAEARPIHLPDLYAQADVTLAQVRKLVKAGLVRFGAEEVWRDPLADRDFMPADPPALTGDQARIWGRLKIAMLLAEDGEEDETLSPFLLHGVTGSGKTEIYMRAIELALDMEKTAVVLVPEIALTPQTVRRFAARFPGRVAVMHSRLTDGERYDTWRRARQGEFDILVGPRSALFAPLPNLGVIVLDEEHDPSYKQTPPIPPPYYHARDAAIALGKITGAAVILGSATPDVVTYHRAKAEEYQLLELPRRVMGHRQRIESQATRLQIITQYQQQGTDPDDALTIPLPPIQIVDLRQELRAGNRSIFSRALQKALDETLERGEQAILFLNRRGSSSFVICRDCGHTMSCPKCDLPLTYHRKHMALTCHQCGHKEPQPNECPTCGSKRIKYFGLGTEQLEQQVKQRWPHAQLTRWDKDTTAGRNTHENLLSSFINQEANVLVGTQMIAKGLDLPLVTLVGVISADVSLGLPDYKTGERAFQLLAQVAGRAGRGLLGGRVILQTYQPEHYAIQSAADHDFISFYLDEIRFRTQHGLPPFRRLAKLVYRHHNTQIAEQEARKLASELRWQALELSLSATEIIGPQPPFFARIGGLFRWQIIIRSPDPLRLLQNSEIPHNWVVDIDPVSLL